MALFFKSGWFERDVRKAAARVDEWTRKSHSIVNRLIQAQAHAEAQPYKTTLKIWRDGVEVEMVGEECTITKRVSWLGLEYADINLLILDIDTAATQITTRRIKSYRV